ncbi:MAG TPA: hypothetical protein ENN56_02990, partial [Firmicutes bacterium]|nr:hypothetical protein [Bacillota bacterium]
MQNVQYPQSIVGIVGKGATLVVRSTDSIRIEVLNAPDGMRPRTTEVTGAGEVSLELTARNRCESGITRIRVTNTNTNESEEVAIPTKVWGPRMSFVCLVQSSNVHIGWDPRPMAQYYRRDDDELVMYPGDSGGNHAWVHARKLERVFHKHNTPITWLIDDAVAEEQATQIRDWHGRYGDAVAFLPRSFFYYNKRNYNLTSGTDELIDALRPQVRALESAFAGTDWPLYCRTMGADQWVGSPGTRFVEAADALGFEGLWGIGYDHDTCDTSMYHKGTPWDVYKPRQGNF